MANRQQPGTRDVDGQHAAMPVLQLGEVQAQETVQRAFGAVVQVGPGQLGHAGVIVAFAVRVQGIPALVMAQVALELGADVVQLVEKRDELVVEVLVEEVAANRK